VPLLELQDVTKAFDGRPAVDGVALAVEEGEIVALLGPSGCGKTTLLRVIAGLEQPYSGAIALAGHSLAGTPPEGRGFGLMFQDLALFPHLNVWENIAFGLRMQRRSSPQAVASRVAELLETVGLPGYGSRRTHQLSGGERQRVALARSLAPQPRLLMLDEPMGALDRRLRETLYIQVRRILKEIGIAALYVTHDHDEAFAVADRVVVMRAGRFVQSGPPEEVYTAPASPFVARFLGYDNLLAARVLARGETVLLETALGPVEVLGDAVNFPFDADAAILLIPEEAISLHPARDLPGLSLSGTVVERRFQRGRYRMRARVRGVDLAFSLLPTLASIGPAMGDTVLLHVDLGILQILPAGDGEGVS
jgi:ABC-type Fe3+/spermidine/putrescine transport system ATPase subunit